MIKEQAIKNLLEIVELSKDEIKNGNTNIAATLDYEDLKSLQIALDMIEEKDTVTEKLKADNKNAWQLNANMSKRHLSDILKINKKDKQIYLMAEYIARGDIEEDICVKTGRLNECDSMAVGECENCIKQYFENKAKE